MKIPPADMRIFIFLGLISLLLSACTAEELPRLSANADCNGVQASYAFNVEAIIENSCAYAGCHPEYDSYEGLLPVLEDGSFRSRVITLRADANVGMPPDYAPANRPRSLSEEEVNLLECWLDDDFPQD